MIYESQTQQEGSCLFQQPEQLLHLKDQLLVLLQRNQNSRSYCNTEYNGNYFNDSQIKQHEDINNLFNRLQQNQQLVGELNAQMLALGDIAIKMIDYITQTHQKRVDQALKHQQQLETLTAQLQFSTQKNNLIQGDIEIFRERLMIAQSQIEEIQKVQNQKELNQKDDSQNQRKIQLLQHQLEQLKSHLNVRKTQYYNKQADLTTPLRFMKSDFSQKLIQLKRKPSALVTSPFSSDQVIENLKQKIRMVQYQNQVLRSQIQLFKEANHKYLDQIPDLFNEHANFIDYDRQIAIQMSKKSPQTFAKVSSSYLKSAEKQQQQIPTQYLASHHQSVQKFHPLSNEWSIKSFQINLGQINIDSHLSNLIYLNSEQQEKQKQVNRIPQTKQTQNSLPDSELNLMQKKQSTLKVMSDKEVNTKSWAELQLQIQQQNQIKETNKIQTQQLQKSKQKTQENNLICQNTLKKTLTYFANSFYNIRERLVEKRIKKSLHREKHKERNKNMSYC